MVINPSSNDGSTDAGFGYTGTSSELAHLYYTSLGNLGEWFPKATYDHMIFDFANGLQDGIGYFP